MTYIHELADWPNFTFDLATLARPLAAVRHRQGQLLGRMQQLGMESVTEATLATLTADAVTTSAIEGEKLDPLDVRSSLALRLGIDVGGYRPARRDVDDIVEVLLDATRRYGEPLTSERLFGWHAALFPTGHSGLSRITVGAWRTRASGPMQVVSGPIGRERVHFEAPAADRLDAEMAAFLDWFGRDDELDPVLKVGIAHLWFVTIHPFDDGNGRIGRAIADMQLARADATEQRFYSLSAAIEASRADYYRQLESQQRGTLDITEWLTWFLGCLDRAIDRAEETLMAVLLKPRLWSALSDRPVNPRQRLVLNRLLDGFEGNLTTSKYAKLGKCSADTALRDIREFVAWGVLVTNTAGGRSTSYRLLGNDHLDRLRADKDPPPPLQ